MDWLIVTCFILIFWYKLVFPQALLLIKQTNFNTFPNPQQQIKSSASTTLLRADISDRYTKKHMQGKTIEIRRFFHLYMKQL